MAEQKDYEALFLDMHPGFFDKENIRNLEEKTVCNELILWLDEFQPDVYTKAFDSSVSFGYLQQNDRKRLLTAWTSLLHCFQ